MLNMSLHSLLVSAKEMAEKSDERSSLNCMLVPLCGMYNFFLYCVHQFYRDMSRCGSVFIFVLLGVC